MEEAKTDYPTLATYQEGGMCSSPSRQPLEVERGQAKLGAVERGARVMVRKYDDLFRRIKRVCKAREAV